MRAHLGSEAVFERSDDASPVGIVLRIGAGDQEDIQGQPDAVAPDLDILFFHQVEKTDLNPFGQVRQLVNRKNAAVGPAVSGRNEWSVHLRDSGLQPPG